MAACGVWAMMKVGVCFLPEGYQAGHTLGYRTGFTEKSMPVCCRKGGPRLTMMMKTGRRLLLWNIPTGVCTPKRLIALVVYELAPRSVKSDGKRRALL